MPTSVGPDDFLPIEARRPGPSPPRPSSAIRNVIVFVMESARASDVGAVGGRQGVTPTIDTAAAVSRIYPNAYAHVPSTAHSLASLMLSVYPPHTFRIPTRESPDIALPSLADELRRQGYRQGSSAPPTAGSSGRTNFCSRTASIGWRTTARFSASVKCSRNSDPSWPFADGTSSRCAVRR